jgi:hypothetical protein
LKVVENGGESGHPCKGLLIIRASQEYVRSTHACDAYR